MPVADPASRFGTPWMTQRPPDPESFRPLQSGARIVDVAAMCYQLAGCSKLHFPGESTQHGGLVCPEPAVSASFRFKRPGRTGPAGSPVFRTRTSSLAGSSPALKNGCRHRRWFRTRHPRRLRGKTTGPLVIHATASPNSTVVELPKKVRFALVSALRGRLPGSAKPDHGCGPQVQADRSVVGLAT